MILFQWKKRNDISKGRSFVGNVGIPEIRSAHCTILSLRLRRSRNARCVYYTSICHSRRSESKTQRELQDENRGFTATLHISRAISPFLNRPIGRYLYERSFDINEKGEQQSVGNRAKTRLANFDIVLATVTNVDSTADQNHFCPDDFSSEDFFISPSTSFSRLTYY